MKTVQENVMLSGLLLKSQNKVKEMAGQGQSFVPDGRPNRVVGRRSDLAPIMFPHLYLLEQVIDLILCLLIKLPLEKSGSHNPSCAATVASGNWVAQPNPSREASRTKKQSLPLSISRSSTIKGCLPVNKIWGALA